MPVKREHVKHTNMKKRVCSTLYNKHMSQKAACTLYNVSLYALYTILFLWLKLTLSVNSG